MSADVDLSLLPDNPYLLLTPGPLSTTKSVKRAMLRDWCTWDDDYNSIVQRIRHRLVALATQAEGYTSVLMQGSGTFSVEATITTVVPEDKKLLVLANGAYGQRIAKIAERMRQPFVLQDSGELDRPDLDRLAKTLQDDPSISHVAVVHCETTTGMLNPIEEIGPIVKEYRRVYIVDAMSSFGGIPMDVAKLGCDYLISSANKCIQGVPGFGFVIAREEEFRHTKGRARSLSLDLYDQWLTMEEHRGKWRYTSPTHTVRAFAQALDELDEEGGVTARHDRYRTNQRLLVEGMESHGFRTLLSKEKQSPIITTFQSPDHPDYQFTRFYEALKKHGYTIYPGKVTDHDTFRIGNIGDVSPADIEKLIAAVGESIYWG